MAALSRVGVEPHIWTMPCEIEGAIPFDTDEVHRSYDGEAAQRFSAGGVAAGRPGDEGLPWRGLSARPARCISSGAGFDLAVTRFSGRRAPPHPGSPLAPASVSVEAYSHEVSSCGFWPGARGVAPMFYAYAYPDPPGFAKAPVSPSAAGWDVALGEFLLPYEAVRTAADPYAALMAFFQSTYEAAADLAHWPRAELERDPTPGGRDERRRSDQAAAASPSAWLATAAGATAVGALAVGGALDRLLWRSGAFRSAVCGSSASKSTN